GQAYGLSARGLAIDTAEPDGEEFPVFRAFWIETPDGDARFIRIHALLDSPSVAGAYRFDVVPGDATVMDVEATLYPRRDLSHIGIAPLTSMFLYDDTNRDHFDDFRPAVHDSEGLMVINGNGEQIWRPLANPSRLQISQFLDNNPRGFGLVQRNRALGAYSDLEARYEKRPSAWVIPADDWGRGSVALVEIPTRREINDNIVAYWRPSASMMMGGRYDLKYRLLWCWQPPEPSRRLIKVINTSMGAKGKTRRRVVIDFEAGEVPLPDPDDIRVDMWVRPGTASKPVLQKHPGTGGLRLAFSFDPEGADLLELRAQLRRPNRRPLSEVWLYRWTS
ncbi:MAG: glucan biosynthesis protein G, partial [Rhizobiales bacterium]|nr:glucan biosynthesis protein G [Hyphomicrobiales bacterium]